MESENARAYFLCYFGQMSITLTNHSYCNTNKVEKNQVIPVRGTLGSIDQLISQALSNGLDVPESRLPGTGGKQVDSLVHPPQG
jgi:hypothetical protein